MSRLAVLVSGTGRHLRNLIHLSQTGRLDTEVALVVSSKAQAPALDHARAASVPALVLDPPAITSALADHGIDWVVLAGYTRRWPIPPERIGRALNIHPSLLPLFGGRGFYGHHVHEAVLASGMRVAGCTVHFVTADYDRGPILAQTSVPVHRDDDVDRLAGRVFAAEAELLPRCIRALATGRVRCVGPTVLGDV